ncbi:MAG TPA: pectin acetylesterase-family hydrolase [Ideonella sp.]|uniref:pectin acetylesterase-family hydrolase n=1 Tax=Ideonella sp. TaxID=1929293 RepID=UPI002BA814FA|nr:pectin acetylesterase-family hydrolase [Ideonella sp.]HSI47917.1 pectin acetylesterase-family hydrolase [Ideonella sp.]
MNPASAASTPVRRLSSRWLARASALLALVVLPAAHAGYFNWDMVELPPESGASCGNGTPYRFFVNRTPLNHNVSLTFEGGGACWDQDACEGKGPYSASNPDGIPPDYMHSLQTMAAGGLVTPFTSRLDPFQKVRTQDWTMVYLPYCTGDVHAGSKVSVYDDVDPSAPRVQHHAGLVNIRAAASWLRSNLGRADDLLVGGFSAGGVGSTVNYATVRDTLAPRGKSTLLADSGPLFNAPRASTTSSTQYPSLPLHQKIRPAWGLDEPGGMIPRLAARLPALDANNLGSLNTGLARAYPQDRFGYLAFETDNVFSGFSYLDFHPEVRASDPAVQKQLVNQLWRTDLANWLPTLAAEANVDYHVPFFRDFNDAHCLGIVDFSGTGVEELGVASLLPFFDNLMDRGPVQRNYETDQVSDLSQPLSPIIQLLNWLENLFV